MLKSFCAVVAASLFFSATIAVASDSAPKSAQKKPVDAVEILNNDLHSKKITLMEEGMALKGKEGKQFWPLYKEFLKKREKANGEVVAFVTEYSKNPLIFTNEKIKASFKDLFIAERNIQALEEEYFEKIGTATSPSIAARFLQVEDIINMVIKFEVLSKLPLFPEIIEADKKLKAVKK